MGDVRQLIGARPDGHRKQQIVFGTVSTEKPAPASFTDTLWVVLPSISGTGSLPFTKWPRVLGTSLPAPGDGVVVGYDERGAPHILRCETSPTSPASLGPAIVMPLSGDTSGATDTASWNALVGAGARIQLQQGRYYGSFAASGINGLTIEAGGAGAVIHNPTAGVDALSAVNCPNLTLVGLTAQGAGGTRDGFHLENCQGARLSRCLSPGSGRAMGWFQRCFGIELDACRFSVGAGTLYPAGVANPQAGAVLTWDGTDYSSGCNGFVIHGGEYVVGQTPQSSTNSNQYMPGWAIEVIRADGGTFSGAPINELSAGGVFMQYCNNVSGPIGYSEFNPSDVSYETGTLSVTAGATAVVGSGTAWNNTAVAPEVPNGFPGKYLVAPVATSTMQFAKIATLTDDTHLSIAAQDELLRTGWQGPTLSGSSYRLVGVQLFLDDCVDCSVTQQRGGSAILMRSTSRCEVNATCEELFADIGCVGNWGTITTNRVTTLPNRITDYGANNLFRQFNWQLNVIVQDTPLPQYTTAQLGAYSPAKPTLALNSTTGHLNYWNGSAWVAL